MFEIKQKILKLATQIAEEQHFEIYDIEIIGKGKILLRVTIDKEGGVTLDDCERFSKELGILLDVEDPIPSAYTLEVSSPGINRKLRNKKDFERNIGKRVRIITKDKIEQQTFFIGKIQKVNDKIKLLVNNHEVSIPFEKISRARLEVEL